MPVSDPPITVVIPVLNIPSYIALMVSDGTGRRVASAACGYAGHGGGPPLNVGSADAGERVYVLKPRWRTEFT